MIQIISLALVAVNLLATPISSIPVSHPRRSSPGPTLVQLSATITATCRHLQQRISSIHKEFEVAIGQIDRDTTQSSSETVSYQIIELYAELSELNRQAARLNRQDFSEEFATLYNAGSSTKLATHIQIENVYITKLAKLITRIEAKFRDLNESMRHRPKTRINDQEFLHELLNGHWHMLSILVLSCFIIYPWKTSMFYSLLVVVLYALIYYSICSFGATATQLLADLTNMKRSFFTSPSIFQWKPSGQQIVANAAVHFQTVYKWKQALVADFELLSKGVEVSLLHEEAIISTLKDSRGGALNHDRRNVANLLRQNTFTLPPLQFHDLRQCSDSGIIGIVQSADSVHRSAMEISDEMSNTLAQGCQAILMADMTITQSQSLAQHGRYTDAADKLATVVRHYGVIGRDLFMLLDKLREVRIEFEHMQVERDKVVGKYKNMQMSAGLVITGSVIATIGSFGASIPAVGSMAIGATGAIASAYSLRKILNSQNLLTELTQFGSDLSGFNEALSRLQTMLFGSKEQMESVVSLLSLAQIEMESLGLSYEQPLDVQAREGLDILFNTALQEQAELMQILNLKATKPNIVGMEQNKSL